MTARGGRGGGDGRDGRGVFITGTDTGVGKTAIACALIRALEARGLRVAPRKPVESGCPTRAGKPMPADAARLARACAHAPPIGAVCRHRFGAAVSPARAARLAGVTLRIGDLVAACACDTGDVAVVEGAGGLLSPIADDGVNADLAVALGFPVVVVAADKLGCINHALLTLEALAARGLAVAALVLNRDTAAARDAALNNADELAALTRVPVVAIAGAWRRDADADDDAGARVAHHVTRALRI